MPIVMRELRSQTHVHDAERMLAGTAFQLAGACWLPYSVTDITGAAQCVRRRRRFSYESGRMASPHYVRLCCDARFAPVKEAHSEYVQSRILMLRDGKSGRGAFIAARTDNRIQETVRWKTEPGARLLH